MTNAADNAGRFTGLAETYQKHRPDYPAAAMEQVAGFWAQAPGVPRRLADVGGGTGKSLTALLPVLGAGWTAAVVEPNDDMRAQAERAFAGLPGVTAVKGGAEALPFPDGALGLVMAAQALHWFDRPRFYAEAARVLAPGGTLLILYNNRDLYDDPLSAAFEDLAEGAIPGYSRDYRNWDLMAELKALAWPREVVEYSHPWTWQLTPEGFAGLMLSRSKMTPFRESLGEAAAQAAIRDLARRHTGPDGTVGLRYVTQAICVRK